MTREMWLCALLALVPLHAAAAEASKPRLDRLEIAVVRAEDVRTLKKLQRAYGYYADRGLWDELANLFADDAVANYPSGGFDGKASIRAMFVENLGQGKQGLAEGRIYNHTILQPVVDLAPDGASATGRWRVLGMLGRYGASATWADSLYRFDYVKRDGNWKIRTLTAYAGSGGGYEQGWVKPAPRPADYVDRSPVRFNLAHPADRAWADPCEADVSVCVVPFPYPNRGGLKQPARVSATMGARAAAVSTATRAADLVRRAQRLEDEQALLNLQHAYGYYLDRGLWQQLADLFAPDGTREVGLAGVYVGRERIRESMTLTGPEGLRDGQINDHMQFEPIIDVAADGLHAKGRVFELGFVGGGGAPGRLLQNVQVNAYVKHDGVWMFQSVQHFTILLTDYAQGWAKSAFPARAASTTLPPDRPPTVTYETYPKVFTPPLHFGNPSVTITTPLEDLPAPSGEALSLAERQAQRAADYDEIENLQSAWGYYAEKSLWPDMAALFTRDGVFQPADAPHIGPRRILAFLASTGPAGPVPGALRSLLQLQPVITLSADGSSARIRSRELALLRDEQGRPMWGGGVYESEVVKEAGIWKFRHLKFTRTYLLDYRGGWAPTVPDTGNGQIFPARATPAFHYRNPVSGRE